MSWEEKLEFTRDLLAGLHISNCVLTQPEERIPPEMATDCGFQDSSYFIRLFKKHFGMTPAVYREQSM